ncbi:MAG: hypothetical protein IJM51_07835 [Clostridia bacterium]|nr:hypothetical protein [Clostridia bacterium]
MNIRESIRLGVEKLFRSKLWNKMTDDSEYQQELASIRYGEKSLLSSGGDSQPMYQIIDRGDSFLFADMDAWQLITDFEHIPDSVLKAKKNLVIQKKDITSVDIGVAYDEEGSQAKLLEYVEIRLRWKVKAKGKHGQKTARRFLSLVLTDEIEEDRLRSFFAGAGRLRLMPDGEFDRLNGHILTGGEVLLKKRLKRAVVGITVASVLCIIGVLLPLRGLRNGFIILGALLPLALFGLVMVFQRYLLVCRGEDSRWDETKWERTIDTEPALVITASAQFILLWACEVRYFPMAEGIFGRWAGLAAVPSAIVAGAMLLVMLSQTSGWKDRLYSALLCLCFALFSCFDAVYLLNGALDGSAPAIHSGQIGKKWTERGYKGGVVYYVRTVREDGITEEFSIFEPEYERVEKGDSILIEEYAGAFGIPYKKAVIPD